MTECVSLISNLLVLFGGFLFFSDLLSPEDTDTVATLVATLLVTSLVVMALFIVADTLPSLRLVVQGFFNDRKQVGAYTRPLLSSTSGVLVSEPTCVQPGMSYDPSILSMATEPLIVPMKSAYVELRSGRL